jgi:ComF family protein
MIFRFIAHIISTCINWIFPPRKSEQTIYPLSEKDILLFPKAKPIDTQTHALFSYKDPRVTSLIWEIKYHKNIRALSLITPLLADVIHAEYSDKTLFEKYQHCILLPVPSTNTRINTYGYVHTHFICEALTPLLPSNITYSPNVLQKIKDTPQQHRLKDRHARLKNLTRSHIVTTNILPHTLVILIDDVTTTGTTLTEARRALKEAGAKDIIAFTIAH